MGLGLRHRFLRFLEKTRLRSLAAQFARALLRLATLLSQEGAGKAGCRLAPAVRCAKMHTQEEPHSSIQVWPITRPSLRGGRTAYAVLSREPNFPSGLPRSTNWMMQSARSGSLAPSRKLDRSNDGQDHTVLPYARPAMSPQSSQPCRRSRKLTGETKPNSAVRRTRPRDHRDYPPCPHHLVPTLPRPPQARLANVTTARSPLDEPGWATHTPKPNFGKGEYFWRSGLTAGRHRRDVVARA